MIFNKVDLPHLRSPVTVIGILALISKDIYAGGELYSLHFCLINKNFIGFIAMKNSIDPRVRIGHVHLKVANLQRAVHFYRDILGFDLVQQYGSQAAFLSAGGYHHHIGLNTWESENASPPPSFSTGLYHVAILYPERRALADALVRLQRAGYPLEGASDHGVSEALYLRDPDMNGLELYWDRPESQWPRTADGELEMFTRRLDLESLRAELGK